ncbi:MAG: helix-turn-helix transcriptional regulator [Methylococcales bacterium]|jgi:transcriptional regulator with XRE-family HTH domain|nr:helix-turn-helix transcriptional regulator [Methylococcales bacterium]MBT7443452.1 helix-turn-helix transcriptional regulator [Methylococcales bacterium]
MTFSGKLKKLRKEHNWSQDQLGKALEIHGRHVGKYESGQVMPGAEVLVKIAKALNVSIDYLLIDDNESPTNGRIHDEELLKSFSHIEQMSEQDRVVIKSLIDAYVKKHQLEKIMS